MKYALIGCGRIATNHIKAVLNNSLELVAVCDIVPERMESLLAKHGLEGRSGIARYTDYTRLLKENSELKLVAIATESGLHAQIALACIDAGVNVIIEKPIAMCMADAEEIIRRSEEKGVTVCACHQNRFNVAVQKTRQALEAGCLMNQCIHGIDLLRWMMGNDVDEVYGVTKQQFHDYLEVEDIGMAVVRFKNGAVATVEGTTNVYPKNLEETLFLFGERGTVKIGGKSTNNLDVWDFADETEADMVNKGLEEQTSNVYGNGHTSLYADVIDAIQNRRKPYVDAVAGRNALELVLAIYKSCKMGRPVKLPLKDFASEDMRDFF